ncbi:optineurin-like [Chlamydotis macqueenii]
MSSKLKSHPAENGEHPKRKTENGTDSMAASALSTYTPEEMVQQMKEPITESNELKEAMKLHNQAMKDRYKELSICREKQKEEQEFYELKFKEVKQCLLDKCMENEKLQQQLQNLKEREGAEMEGCTAPEKEMRQLMSQVQHLQAEKADMLGIISELQVKLNISAEDSFVEIGMDEGEINRTAKEHQENSGEMTSNFDIYGRSKTADESKNLQSEELTVSQLLYCLRNETQKREELEKELQDHKERLSKREKETSNCLKSGTQTEQQAEESSEAVGSEVETLRLQVCALFKELQEAFEKVKEAELIQKKLQEKCQVLERKSSAAALELEEKQQLIDTIKKLELQVESMQAEVKLERAKAHEEKARYSSLQDTNSKLLPELTKAMKTVDEMKLKELHRVDQVVVEQLNAKVELAEQAPVAKQLQIDEMKQIIANYLSMGLEGMCPRMLGELPAVMARLLLVIFEMGGQTETGKRQTPHPFLSSARGSIQELKLPQLGSCISVPRKVMEPINSGHLLSCVTATAHREKHHIHGGVYEWHSMSVVRRLSSAWKGDELLAAVKEHLSTFPSPESLKASSQQNI